MVEEHDRAFAEMLVIQGLVTRAQAVECLMAAEAAGTTLAEELAQRGYLIAPRRADTATPAAAAGDGVPTGAQRAATDPANLLGKYIRTARLGAGGMAEVWRAWDTQLRRWVALKFLRGDDVEETSRFQREAQTVAQLSHPNIAAVHEVGEINGRPYIAMQLISGRTLEAEPRGDLRRSVTLLRDAARAVHFAHQRGVIHRDLKPHNIMVESSTPPRVFVLDFGLARRVDRRSAFSATGAVIGTPGYMSPEQANGRPVDTRCDVYGLGATLYFLCTGRPPFDGALVDVLQMIVHDEPLPPRAINPRVPVDLETIALRCLDKVPGRRYPTADALAHDLDSWLAGEPIGARRPTLAYRASRFVARRKALVATALAAVVVAAIVVAQALVARAAHRAELDRAARAAAEREQALKELNVLWTEVLLAKQGLHNASRDAESAMASVRVAVDRVDAYIAKHPDLPQALYVRAHGHLYLDEPRLAERDLRRSLEIAPEFAPGRALLARVLVERYTDGLLGAIETKFERQQAVEPLLKEAATLMAASPAGPADAWGLARTREERVVEALLPALIACYVRNDRAEGVRLLEAAHRRDPSEDFCSFLGNWAEFVADNLKWQTEALALRPHFPRALRDRAIARVQTGDYDGAIADYTHALRLNPRLRHAHLNRGNARLMKGDVDGAISDYGREIELDPNEALIFVNRSRAHELRGDLDAAQADAERALQLSPRGSAAFVALSLVQRRRNDLAGALESCNRAVDLAPHDAQARYYRAHVHLGRDDVDAAIDDLEAAVRLNPRLAEAHGDLGVAYQEKKEFQKAIACHTRALELKALPASYASRANAREFMARQDPARARPLLEAARDDIEAALRVAPRDWPERPWAEEVQKRVLDALKRLP